eukprot:TRINITY_DN16958_c0_g1_i1.p1 TRINITY_DN16958_c0_g1~~TRINITY_DN16958_c0_g1_i1.p1  ORF type:complete len:282 (-),score=45.05 TRINITY_DN16958_c0_g1_i1:390-1205(-)
MEKSFSGTTFSPKDYDTKDLKPSVVKRLLNELSLVTKNSTEELIKQGFQCYVVHNNLLHWHVKLFNSFEGTEMGTEMAVFESKYNIDHILLEIKFNPSHPLYPPSIRVISPRFVLMTGGVTAGGNIRLPVLNPEVWSPVQTVNSIVLSARDQFIEKNGRLESDLLYYTEEEALIDTEGFYRSFKCFSTTNSSYQSKKLGGKTLLPASALSHIVSLPNVSFPLVFELSNSSQTKITHAGVIEFEAPEGTILVSEWVIFSLSQRAKILNCLFR